VFDDRSAFVLSFGPFLAVSFSRIGRFGRNGKSWQW